VRNDDLTSVVECERESDRRVVAVGGRQLGKDVPDNLEVLGLAFVLELDRIRVVFAAEFPLERDIELP
jgi:hypothetical protein